MHTEKPSDALIKANHLFLGTELEHSFDFALKKHTLLYRLCYLCTKRYIF